MKQNNFRRNILGEFRITPCIFLDLIFLGFERLRRAQLSPWENLFLKQLNFQNVLMSYTATALHII